MTKRISLIGLKIKSEDILDKKARDNRILL